MVLRFLVPVNKNGVIILFVLQKSSLVFCFSGVIGQLILIQGKGKALRPSLPSHCLPGMGEGLLKSQHSHKAVKSTKPETFFGKYVFYGSFLCSWLLSKAVHFGGHFIPIFLICSTTDRPNWILTVDNLRF